MGKASLAAAAVLLTSLSTLAYGQTTNFMTQQGADHWLASKLSGVAIFGPDNKKVGDITDVLMDHDGKASAIVIGVGGFLGLGEKNVAVPFDQVKFTDQSMAGSPGSGVAPSGVPAATMNGVASPAATGLGMPANTTGNSSATMANGTAPGMNSTPGATASNPANGTTAPSRQMTPGMGTTGAPAAGIASGVARSTSYPDHGTIDLTVDQLKSAPSFQFAK